MERLTVQPDFGQFPCSWSKKANAILLMEGRHEATNGDILVLPLAGHQLPKKLVANPDWDRAPSFSPNGKFFVYESEVLGLSEVFVRGYNAETASAEGEPIQIPHVGKHDPLWLPKGDRIVYTDSLGDLVEVKLAAKASPTGHLVQRLRCSKPRFMDTEV
jgi:Tol biopolymer transport system component